MKNEIKIAKELVKLAKNLVGFDVTIDDDSSTGDYELKNNSVADKPGKYENFTGTIEWNKTYGKVKNATFELGNGDNIFNDKFGFIWYDGIWEKGNWCGGIWKKGTWKHGTWQLGRWEGGTWESGTWNSKNYLYCVWEKGQDINNQTHGKNDSPDKW